jgi:hypothetical protein
MSNNKYYSRYEYITERTADWLTEFAKDQAKEIATKNNIDPKKADVLHNILDIVKNNKKTALEEKIEGYRQSVGLSQLADIAKEGNNIPNNKEAMKATRILLSIRDKIAEEEIVEQEDPKELQAALDKINQFVVRVIENRNGSIATPAILEQLKDYVGIDNDWLRKHYSEVEKIIESAKNNFKPQEYNDLQVGDLARTDEPNKNDKEAPIWQPPPTTNR